MKRKESNERRTKTSLRLIRQLKVKDRLLIALLITSLIPMGVLTVFSLKTYTGSLESRLSESYEKTTLLINTNTTSIFYPYSNFITTISMESAVQDFLCSPGTSYTTYQKQTLSRNFMTSLSAHPSPEYPVTVFDIFLFDREGQLVFDKGPTNFLMTDTVQTRLLGKTNENAPRDTLMFFGTDSTSYVLLCRKIYDKGLTNTHIGYIALVMDSSRISSALLPDSAAAEEISLYLTDSFGTVICSEDASRIGVSLTDSGFPESVFTFRNRVSTSTKSIHTENSTIVSSYNPKYALYSIAIVPDSVFSKETRRVEQLVFTMLLLLLFVSLAISLLIYLSLLNPVNDMIRVYGEQWKPDDPHRVNDPCPDELGKLSCTIDRMADENHRMLVRIRQDDRKKRELELNALKYQINPHFLFNTLNTFKWLSSVYNAVPLHNGIVSLTELLQVTLVKNQEFVTLEEELHCLKNYCTIQELRFAGRFTLKIDAVPETLQYMVPRLLLQPLVENAILHGVRDEDDTVFILVKSGLSDGMLKLEITDNGAGFDPREIMDEKGVRFNGIGLSNVSERLSLHYGGLAVLKIISSPGQGTECLILLPAELKHREVSEND